MQPTDRPQTPAQQIIEIARQVATRRGLPRGPELDEPLDQQGLGMDSIGLLSLLAEVEKQLEVDLPEESWDGRSLRTVAQIATLVQSLRDHASED